MANSPLIAGLELGGTKCVAILGTGPDDVRARDTVPTTDPATTLAALELVLVVWQFDALGIASFVPLDLYPHSPAYVSFSSSPQPFFPCSVLTLLLAPLSLPPLSL